MDKRGCNSDLFEFACKQVMAMMEDEKSTKPKAQPTKGQGGVSVSAVAASGPTASSNTNPKQDKGKTKVSATSADGKVDRMIECRRHTIAKESFNTYFRTGRGLSLPEERREKLRWLLKDAEALGFSQWVRTYDGRLRDLERSTRDTGKGASVQGKGSGSRHGGSTMGRGGGKGGRSGSRGDSSQGPRRSNRSGRPAPGHFRGMQSLTISDQPTHQPIQPPAHTPQPAYPYSYNPYQHLTPYYPFINPYAQPIPTQASSEEPTHNNPRETQDETEETQSERTSGVEWDEQGQVGTDVEDEPQHNTWADADSYGEYYEDQGEASEEEYY
jgi:hypothetical protein